MPSIRRQNFFQLAGLELDAGIGLEVQGLGFSI